MSSPMFDLPEHLPFPVDANGDGPADPADTVRVICWCKLGSNCTAAVPPKRGLRNWFKSRFGRTRPVEDEWSEPAGYQYICTHETVGDGQH